MKSETLGHGVTNPSDRWEPQAPAAPTDDLADLHAKIDHLTAAVEKLDRRREELEELVEDLLPAVNGAVVLARDRLDRLERSGAWGGGEAALAAAETALSVLEPDDLGALALSLPELLRTARVLSAPEITEMAPRLLEAVHEARHGPAPSLRSLFKTARAPRTRRGMQVALALLTALGSGTGSATTVLPAPVRRRPAVPPAAPRRATGAIAKAGSTPTPGGSAAAAPGALHVGDRVLALDADGNLQDPTEWDREVAAAFAANAGLELTDTHWTVLDFVREDGAASGAAPGIRRIVAETGVTQKELYGLFPGGPAVLAARLAGLEKPKSCV